MTHTPHTPHTHHTPLSEKDIPLLPLSHDQLEQFHQLEQQRYMSPHKAFRLNLHGYEAVVGPLKVRMYAQLVHMYA